MRDSSAGNVRNRQHAGVVVVGGGPAGAICALMLARNGVRVSLVHWDGYANGGIELVSGQARRLIEQYCPDFFRQAALGLEVHKTILLWRAHEPVTFNEMLGPWGSGMAVDRSLFDRALRDLAQTAGVSVMADAKVVGIERRDSRWHLLMRSGEMESERAWPGFLVLATGRAVNRFFDRLPAGEASEIALMTSLPPYRDASASVPPAHTLYVESMDNGWWYALPASDVSYFAGFCIHREEVKKRRGSLKEFFVRELRRTRLLAPFLSSASGSLQISGRMAGAQTFNRAAGDGWIAIGDAAYAPDPLSGKGIELAIESARLGADALLRAMQKTTKCVGYEEFAAYENAIRERVARHEMTPVRPYGLP